ncbi:hypothetical protein D3C84_996230 [compost metagenome]
MGRIDDRPVTTTIETVFKAHVIGAAVEFDGRRRVGRESMDTLEFTRFTDPCCVIEQQVDLEGVRD